MCIIALVSQSLLLGLESLLGNLGILRNQTRGRASGTPAALLRGSRFLNTAMYMYAHVCVYIYIYIYMYRERERERERQRYIEGRSLHVAKLRPELPGGATPSAPNAG